MTRGLCLFAGMSAAVAMGLAAATSLHAQSLTFAPKDSQEPVEVTAENGMELHQDTKRVIARGNAKAVQGAVSVTADELTADYRTRPSGGEEVYRVYANGNVIMKSENETATGQAAVYDFDKAVLVLEGENVSLVSADGEVTSHKVLQYWANERVAVAEGKAFAQDKNKHRLYGDRLVAFFREPPAAAKSAPAKGRAQILGGSRGDINYVQGFGNVRMETQKEIIRGDRGAYNIDSGIATIEGGVKVTQGSNQLAGGFAVVNVKGGASSVYGSAAQAKMPGLKENTRVQALIAPKTNPAAP
ncbi:MAG: LptA/OstA family protein [Rhodospirillaceae bacterium]